jgi:hypothetical protein
MDCIFLPVCEYNGHVIGVFAGLYAHCPSHLLGGRYGFDPDKHAEMTMEEIVAHAIKVAREIRRQLARLEQQEDPAEDF